MVAQPWEGWTSLVGILCLWLAPSEASSPNPASCYNFVVDTVIMDINGCEKAECDIIACDIVVLTMLQSVWKLGT